MRLLDERLGASFSRALVRRLHDVSGGNPFYALELGRALLERGVEESAPPDDLPLPDDLRELVAGRLRALPPDVRDVLIAVAALSSPTVSVVESAVGSGADDALREAVDARIVEFDGERVRFTHPLLGSTLLASAVPSRRREVHRRLAEVLDDVEQRARHLALAVDGTDAAVALAVDDAAAGALRRGAPAAAVELGQLSLRLTPAGDREGDARRRSALAGFLLADGEPVRARELLEAVLTRLQPGAERAEGLFLLAQTRQDDFEATLALLDRALGEAAGDDAVLARMHRARSEASLIAGDLGRSLRHAREGIAPAERSGDRALLALTLAQACSIENLAGDVTPGLLERALELEAGVAGLPAYECPSRSAGLRAMFAGDFDRARTFLETALSLAIEQGDDIARGGMLLHLTELEQRAGNWQRAAVLAAEGFELVGQLGLDQARSALLWARALVDAHLGRVEEARAAAEEGLALSRAAGERIYAVYNASVLGFLELSLGRPTEAHAYLATLPAEVAPLSWGEPSVYPLLADAIEALIGIGKLDLAGQQLDALAERSRRHDSTWGLAVSGRCAGLLALAVGETERAVVELERALDVHGRYPGAFERGRTELALGVALRKARRRREAYEALTRAAETFRELGAARWQERAHDEFARLGGRPIRSGSLTGTEDAIARLVAAGRSNQQVADELYMSPKTVEWNLSKVYRKLAVRSRTELAAKLARRSQNRG